MRKSILILVALLIAPLAIADQCQPFTGGLGYARYLPTTAKKLTDAPTAGVSLPAGTTGAVIFVNVAPIRYRTDGTNPTASEGVQVPAGTSLVFRAADASQLSVFAFIEASSGAEVTVAYCH